MCSQSLSASIRALLAVFNSEEFRIRSTSTFMSQRALLDTIWEKICVFCMSMSKDKT